jgi:hypothetical protein
MNFILWCWIFLYELYTMMLTFSLWIVHYDFGFFYMNCILRCWIFLYELYTMMLDFSLWIYILMLDFSLWIVYYDVGFFFMNCILWCWLFIYELYAMMLDFSIWIVYYVVGFFFMNCILCCWIFLYELYTMMLEFSLWILYYDARIHEHQVCGVKFDWIGWGRRLFKCWTSKRSRTKEVGRMVGQSVGHLQFLVFSLTAEQSYRDQLRGKKGRRVRYTSFSVSKLKSVMHLQTQIRACNSIGLYWTRVRILLNSWYHIRENGSVRTDTCEQMTVNLQCAQHQFIRTKC